MLEINNSHKVAMFNELVELRKVTIPVLGAKVGMSLFSGCSNNEMTSVYKSSYVVKETVKQEKKVIENSNDDVVVHKVVDGDTVLEVPSYVAKEVARFKGVEYSKDMGLTTKDFKCVEWYRADFTEDLSWLKYCDNLDYLEIKLRDNSYGQFISKDVVCNMPNLIAICITNSSDRQIDFNKFGFLANVKSLKRLELEGYVNVEPGLLESFTNIKTLSISSTNPIDIDFSKLTHLSVLEFYHPEVVAEYFSVKDYLDLQMKGVNVKIFDYPWVNRQDGFSTYLNIVLEKRKREQEALESTDIGTTIVYESVSASENLDGTVEEYQYSLVVES